MAREHSATSRLVIALSVAAFAACSSPQPSDQSGQRSPASLKVGYIPVTHCLPLFVAVDEGLFAREGLKVELLSLAGGAKILEALAAREVDVGFSNVVSPMLARSQGLPFVLFGGGPVEDEAHRDHAIMVRKDDPARSVQDLKGRTIALNTRRAIDHVMLLLLLEKHGLAERDVTLVEVPFPRMLAALSSKAADAVAIAEPFITLGLDTADTRVLDWNYVSVRPVTYVSTYVTHEEFARTHRDALARFERGLTAGALRVQQDAAAARSILARHTRLAEAVAARVRLPRFEPQLDWDNLRETLALARKHGILEKDVDLDGLRLKGT